MSPLLFALQTDFDTIKQVHNYCSRDPSQPRPLFEIFFRGHVGNQYDSINYNYNTFDNHNTFNNDYNDNNELI